MPSTGGRINNNKWNVESGQRIGQDLRPRTSSSHWGEAKFGKFQASDWSRPRTASSCNTGRTPAESSLSNQVGQPQRLPLPRSIKVPNRVVPPTRDEKIVQSLQSRSQLSSFGKPNKKTTKSSALLMASKNNNTMLQKLRDLQMLAITCERASLRKQQANVYLSMGILHDNLGHWHRAIRLYKKYLAICLELNDSIGEHIALNNIGICYYLVATHGQCETRSTVGIGHVSVDYNALKLAIEYHQRHESVARGIGKFMAYTNLGICHGCKGDHSSAAQCHQNALRTAVSVQNTSAQSIAIGNLALVGKLQGDLASAKLCLSKHLSLAKDLGNWTAESLACHQLGSIANKQGNYVQATQYLEEARMLAKNNNEQGMLNLVNCELGVTNGNLRLAQYVKSLTSNVDQC